MSRTLLHDWEGSIERNKNNTEELLNIAEDIYNTAYTRGKAITERPQGDWIETVEHRGYFAGDRTVYSYTCPFCKVKEFKKYPFCHCGADMRGKEE
jgi:hypothetical protein